MEPGIVRVNWLELPGVRLIMIARCARFSRRSAEIAPSLPDNVPIKDIGTPALNRRRKQHRHKNRGQTGKLLTAGANTRARGKTMGD